MFKAVVFDLFETLVSEAGVEFRNAGSLGESLGLDPRAYRREWKQRRPLVLRGQMTFRQALTEIGERLDVPVRAGLIDSACADRERARAALLTKIDPDVLALTDDLRQAGIRLGVISNCIAEDASAWPESALAPRFDCAVFSCSAGRVKPEVEIYLDTVGRLGVTPGEALYIGDGGDDELAGAERAGLRAAQAGWFVTRALSLDVPLLVDRHEAMRCVLS